MQTVTLLGQVICPAAQVRKAHVVALPQASMQLAPLSQSTWLHLVAPSHSTMQLEPLSQAARQLAWFSQSSKQVELLPQVGLHIWVPLAQEVWQLQLLGHSTRQLMLCEQVSAQGPVLDPQLLQLPVASATVSIVCEPARPLPPTRTVKVPTRWPMSISDTEAWPAGSP